ncbi:4-hydroxyphenylacetate 3-monooxygenase reductase component [Oligella sp. MSHR50489EDL]|uniref:flavin reductase n=1 Tax=Oligella sp. MSHR50489EDL TaxID=3139409 RepID=UPI003D8192C6
MTKVELTPSQLAFRDAMSSICAAVNIITTNGPAGKCGMTATAVCSITDSPPTIMIAVNQNSKVNATIKENGVACVNVLTKELEEAAKDFAGFTQLAIEERFGKYEWGEGEHDLPYLEDALVSFGGQVIQTIEMGTHSLFFVEVDGIRRKEGRKGLVYFSRAFHAVGEEIEVAL